MSLGRARGLLRTGGALSEVRSYGAALDLDRNAEGDDVLRVWPRAPGVAARVRPVAPPRSVFLVRCGVTLHPVAALSDWSEAVDRCRSLDGAFGDAFVDEMELSAVRDPCSFNNVYQRNGRVTRNI